MTHTLTRKNQVHYAPCPDEPAHTGTGIPQRWDFTGISKFIGIPVLYAYPNKNGSSRSGGSKSLSKAYLRKDLAHVAAHYPEDLFKLRDQIDLITLLESYFSSEDEPATLDNLGLRELYMGFYPRIADGTIPKYQFSKDSRGRFQRMNPRDLPAYASIPDMQGLVKGFPRHPGWRGVQEAYDPEHKPTEFELSGGWLDNRAALFMAQLHKIHKAYNIRVLRDYQSGTYATYNNNRDSKSEKRTRKSSFPPACFRKEILHILCHPDSTDAAKTRLVEGSGSILDLEAQALDLGLYHEFYPLIKLETERFQNKREVAEEGAPLTTAPRRSLAKSIT